MSIVPETNDQGNYAAERVMVGAQGIDPNSSGESAGFHGWLQRAKRQSSEATVADILALEGRYQEAAAELATLKAERDRIAGMDDFVKSSIRDIIIERNFYRTERDMLEAGVKQWSAEAARAQAEVIALADGAAQLRTAILALADGLHYNQAMEAWVLKGPLGDLLGALADELRNGEKG